MDIAGYIETIGRLFATGHATEHSYRPALQALFASIDPALTIINEPKRSEAGMPDFLFQRGTVPCGWAEAKDVDKDIRKLAGYSVDQRKRYARAYPNLLYTNGVDFEFIREGDSVHFVSIADYLGAPGGLQVKPDSFAELERHLRHFAEAKPISVRSASKLAELMAAKAQIIKEEIEIALRDDPDLRSGLAGQFKSFQANLLPALTPDEFADIYAETITYGMFAARFHDDDLSTFSRQEAMDDLPASNPFLKGLFQYIAGPMLPDRLKYIVDDLVELMRASDPHSLFRDFGKFTARNDPFVHFYEDFLAAYNPKKRKSRGVWYTPEPVVDFIVRAVDDVLKTEFGLPDGLADTSKVTVDWDTGQDDPKTGKPRTIRKEVHKVQILDPATGTGTFLAKAVQLISDRVKARAPGKWSSYVEEDLLPRLHGFELLMASYAMCHMKLDMQLTESGYKPSAKPPRLSVWLTNALEPAEREIKDLFFQPLAEEARGASEVKRQTPIMCVIGNPPYSGESANKGGHITKLMNAYKLEPGGKEKLKERTSKWINDDYVKFIRMSEALISQNPSGGVLGFITNHGYLDNPTFRGMRWHLLKTFDKIWVLDLHGNSKKSEASPSGSIDKNVFDIQQGVSLIIASRRGRASESLADIRHGDVWGSRTTKNMALHEGQLTDLSNKKLTPSDRFFFFRPFEDRHKKTYDRGFDLKHLFGENGAGIITTGDGFVICDSASELRERFEFYRLPSTTAEDMKKRFDLGNNYGPWALSSRQTFQKSEIKISRLNYRPFDQKFFIDDDRLIWRPRRDTMSHFTGHPNLSLVVPRQVKDAWHHSFVSELVTEFNLTGTAGRYGSGFVYPLYLYPDADAAQADALASTERTHNLDPKLFAAICDAGGIDSASQAGPLIDFRASVGDARPSEIKVFDYIYGVLHAPNYRKTFAEFLKVDFPQIPYPPSPNVFRHVSEKGEALRRLHLMEAAAIGDTPYPFHGEGDDIVAAGFPKLDGDRVMINKDQYFAGVPSIAWTFHIGGYQPAQKWLKDRRGRALSWDDIGHYQKIVKILAETDRIMREIDLPLDVSPDPN